MKVNKPKKQHYIPKVYLRQFEIDDSSNKNFVFCFNHGQKFQTRIQKIGVGDKVFTIKQYMTHTTFEDPYIIEKIYAEDIESLYNGIISELSTEKNLTHDTRNNILTWLVYIKYRSPILREITQNGLKFFFETENAYNKNKITDEDKISFERFAEQAAKEAHLNLFLDKEAAHKWINMHINTLIVKSWTILKSTNELPFITNDNPGFSPNLHPMFAERTPFHHVMELNSDSIIFYVLSPKYCLRMTPFIEGTPPHLNASNMEIEYVQLSNEEVDFVNMGVTRSSYKLIVSNDKKILHRYLKVNSH